MDYLIRTYQKTDFDLVINLLRLNTPKYFDPTEELELVSYLKEVPENFYVLLIDGKIVGTGGHDIIEELSQGVLSWYFLDPAFQGKGLGSVLVQKNLEEIKKSSEIKRVIVRTSQFADSFFAKQGFELLGIEKDYWAKGYDLYMMRMDL